MPALTARNLSALLASLLVCLALLAGAGCGGDDDDAASNGDSTSQATDAPDDGGSDETDAAEETDTPPDADDDGSGDEPEGACLLSEEEVADAMSQDVTATQFSAAEPLYSCQYSTVALTSGMNLTVFFGEDVADAQSLFDASDEEEPVQGLGDAAEWSEESTALSVMIDDMVLGVQFYGLPPDAEGSISIPDAKEVAIGLAEVTIPRLP